MEEVTRDNHYVPQAIIRRWSVDKRTIQAYRVLVSHAGVPLWSPQEIRGVAYARDLYTEMSEGGEQDKFEKWIEAEFETPGLAAADRAVRGLRLFPDDWRALIRLYAAQNVRTPSSYLEFKEWSTSAIQPALDASVARAVEMLEAQAGEDTPRATADPKAPASEIGSLVRVKIDDVADHEGNVTIRGELTAGRRLWIAQMRQLLTGVVETLCEHRWSILTPYGEEEWPLTDHPALRVNYNGPDDYDVGGGWGFTGSDLMMPLSPHHLLHVEVGKRGAPRSVCPLELTKRIQRVYAETALRWIFGTRPYAWVEGVRPRVVDERAFKSEAEQWRGWHDDQTASEES